MYPLQVAGRIAMRRNIKVIQKFNEFNVNYPSKLHNNDNKK